MDIVAVAEILSMPIHRPRTTLHSDIIQLHPLLFFTTELLADDVKRLHADPDVVSLSLILSGAAQHLHMKPFSVAALEVRETVRCMM